MSSGNKKTEHPSFRATLIIYVAFNFLSSSAYSITMEFFFISLPLMEITSISTWVLGSLTLKCRKKGGRWIGELIFLRSVITFMSAQELWKSNLCCFLWHTTFTLCYKAPVDNPWLDSTKKLKEENPTWKVLILKKSCCIRHLTINHQLKLLYYKRSYYGRLFTLKLSISEVLPTFFTL